MDRHLVIASPYNRSTPCGARYDYDVAQERLDVDAA